MRVITINEQDIRSHSSPANLPENKCLIMPTSTKWISLLVHGRCATLAEISTGRFGLGDTLGEDSSILVL